jgi:predicted metal-dependent HD superfamily phosphohydrolase
VRKEYAIYPDLLYRPGRIKVLKYFLEKPRIYHTPYFWEKYEEQARANMEAELLILTK